MKFFALPLPAMLLTILVLLGCSESEPGVFVDSRDGQKYKTVDIGNYTWMARNLNYNTDDSLESWCYENKDSYCKKYGRLYNWGAAMQSCPGGWHLPGDEEWDDLAETAGGWRFAANALKSNVDDNGSWWSATESNELNAYVISSYHEELSRPVGLGKSLGKSVRCVKDYDPDNLSAIQARKFELLTPTSVELFISKEERRTYGKNCFECKPHVWRKNILVEKTATGTIVNNKTEAELSAEEWLDFIRALYKLRVNEWNVNEWKEKYGDSKNIESWNLEIWSSNKNEPDSFKDNSTFPPNWKEFKKLIDDMAAKVKKKGER